MHSVRACLLLVVFCSCGGAAGQIGDGGVASQDAVVMQQQDAGVDGNESMLDADGPDIRDHVAGVSPVLEGGSGIPPSDASGSQECNPVQPFEADASHIACPENQQCNFGESDPTAFRCGGTGGPGVQGAGCMYTVDCSAGYYCATVHQSETCARYCRIGAAFDDCGTMYSCTPFLAFAAYDGSQEIGVCL